MSKFAAIASMPFTPLRQTVRAYNRSKLKRDMLAGLTVSVIDVPQAMAYAYIAGLPPVYGLYTSIIQGFIGALFSSNGHLATGPTNTHSLLIASIVVGVVGPGNEMVYLQTAVALALIKGIIQLLFAGARMGNLIRYVSKSVIIGFTAGAGVLIATGQIAHFLGLDVGGTPKQYPGVVGTVVQLLPHLGEVNPRSVVLGAGSIAVILLMRLWSRLVPGPLIAVIIGAVVVFLMGWSPADIEQVGDLPAGGLPMPALPVLTWSLLESLMAGAFALALLGMIESVAISKSLAPREGNAINANREFFAQGMANMVGSFFHTFPGSGSFTRSALNYSAGSQTRFAAMFNSLFMLIILLLLSRQARYIPLTCLAAILFVVAYGLINVKYMVQIARASRSDAWVCFISFIAALILPLQYAIYVGIFLNIAFYMRQATRLHLAEMVQTPAGPFDERPLHDRQGQRKVVFLQAEGDLFFGVADELRDHLKALYDSPVRVVILRLKRTHSIDATAMSVLEAFTREMQERDRHVILCGVKPELMRVIRQFGLIEVIGKENVFKTSFGVFTSAKRAIERAKELVGASIDAEFLDGDDQLEAWAYEI